MILDCFTFFDELDLLEIRLATLDEVVDRFVIVESPYTFASQPKPLYYSDNKARFKSWAHKIEHYVIRQQPMVEECRWFSEYWQRDALSFGWRGLDGLDLVMVSDVDEIPTPKAIREAAEFLPKNAYHVAIFHMTQTNYFANVRNADRKRTWAGPVMTTAKCLWKKRLTPEKLRGFRSEKQGEDRPFIWFHGGWHFCGVRGGFGAMGTKTAAFAHANHDREETRTAAYFEEQYEKRVPPYRYETDVKLELVPVDVAGLPAHMMHNLDKFHHLVKGDAMQDFRGKHKGQRAVIVCNGPSLKRHDLSVLDNEVTFGLNLIMKIGLQTTYWCLEDEAIAKRIQDANLLEGQTAVRFVASDRLKYVPESRLNVAVNFERQKYSLKGPKFSDDCASVVYVGYSVTYMALQLAAYMGCSPIILIGRDKVDPAIPIADHVYGYDPAHKTPQAAGFLPGIDALHQPIVARKRARALADAAFTKAWEHLKAKGVEILDATDADVRRPEFRGVSWEEVFGGCG